MHTGAPIIIGISSCLLGKNVRFDGRNKYDRKIVEALGQYADFMPVCPETAIGLGVPRPPLGLIAREGRVAAVGVDNPAMDVTEALTGFGKEQASLLHMVCGYIFKSRSPSCGLTDTPITTDGEVTKGSGLYTRQVIEAMPLLPVTDEAMLKIEIPANNFLERAFAYNRWQQLRARPLTTGRLQMFHKLHTPELERHHASQTVSLADFLHSEQGLIPEVTALSYLETFMTALQMPVVMDIRAGDLFEKHMLLSTEISNHAD